MVTMIAWDKQRQNKLNVILQKYSTNREQERLPVPVYSRILRSKKYFGCSDFFYDFCQNSTIHGIKFMGDRKRHLAERLWWLIAFLVSVFWCARLMLNVWERWDRSPVIVTFAERPTPIWQIPFPAVTICLQTKTQSNLFNFTDISGLISQIDGGFAENNFTKEEIDEIDAISQVCDPINSNSTVGSFFASNRIVNIMEELTPTPIPLLFLCKWRNEQFSCPETFSKILTEEGICYTFNNLDQSEIFREENLHSDFRYIESKFQSKDWSVEKGYSINATLSSYPERVQTAGARTGLTVIIPLSIYDMDYICKGPSQGFKVQLHTPGEMPQLSQQFFRLSLEQEIIISVKPNMITTSDVLKGYAINRRQCYFQEERYLRFFKIYTQQNCEMECLANYTLDKCGCVKFSMPRDSKTRVCGARSVSCYYDAEDELFNPYEGPTHEDLGCNCLPACTAITYDAETSQADFDWRKLVEAHGAPPGSFPGDKLGRLMVFFRDSQFITSRRSELYGPTDFFANCGGLLGLFLGVSILSLFEVVYFFTLRVWYSVRKFNADRARKVGFIEGRA